MIIARAAWLPADASRSLLYAKATEKRKDENNAAFIHPRAPRGEKKKKKNISISEKKNSVQ